MEPSVIYYCIFYLVYVLMPIFPAIIIYKKFPSTTVGVSGMLGGLKVNSTGAFAAYIVSCLLGVFIVKKALIFIEDENSKNWTVNAQVQFVDENNQPLPLNEDEKERMTLLTNVATNPSDPIVKTLARYQFKFNCKSDLPCVRYSYGNGDFAPTVIDLDTMKTGINRAERKINLGIVYLRKSQNKYYQVVENSDYAANETSTPK